ncbi:head GIN domain-containing protein [Sphingobacterium spiritivorum]|nr:head GIN domain-containing protein [Sphingobacterium spiritivorum]QQS94870.1 DUF2807 domain-containing protein [Sphingobacterium spiritivorum]
MKKIIAIGFLFMLAKVGMAQTREVGPFAKVEVTDKINVELINSSTYKVVISGNPSNEVDVIQKNGTLRLKMNTLNMMNGEGIHIKVYGNNISELTAKKGAIVKANEEEILSSNILNLSASEGGLLSLKVSGQEIKVSASKGGTVQASGKTPRQEVQLTFGGNYDGRSLVSENAKVTVNGGGRCEVNVKQTIDSQVRAGGIIHVYGNPAQRNEKKLAGGTIEYK